jgi:hypothetical protein
VVLIKMKNISLENVKVGSKDRLNFRDLYNEILAEIDRYEQRGQLDELMDQELVMDLVDGNGHVLSGSVNLFVGWVESGSVVLSGSLEDVYEEKGMSK